MHSYRVYRYTTCSGVHLVPKFPGFHSARIQSADVMTKTLSKTFWSWFTEFYGKITENLLSENTDLVYAS